MPVSDKIIQKLFDKWRKKLKIKTKVMWLTDFTSWNRLVQQQRLKQTVCMPFGAVGINKGIKPNFVFINKKLHGNNEDEIENTILHELQHIKHPNFPEAKIRKITDKIIPRKKIAKNKD